MVENKLKLIDFSAGVSAQPLNYNYEIIHGWIKRERLRIGGYGLCEGFDMTYPGNFVVNISEGVLIDYIGDEIMVPATNFNCGAPSYETVTEKVIVNDDGVIELRYKPYSPSSLGLITLNPPYDNNPIKDEELIVKRDVTGQKIAISQVIGQKIYLQSRYAGELVDVTYQYCDDRIDAFMVDSEGHYSCEIGINATSPSVANIELGKRFLIGFAHWIIGRTIDVEFIMDERTYRRVYVDSLNRLYLNGKLYKESKWIYFQEPAMPEENDVWYDHASNTLMVYCFTDGAWGWRVMNDFTNMPMRTVKIWTAEECPDDLQTFLFNDDEMNLRYIPNTEALDIVIDQQVVMADQYEEVVQPGSKPYLASGIGFKLANPLDRATVVQCIVHQVVRNAPLRNVFQRAAIFVTENFYTVNSESNPDQIFFTDLPYAIGAAQLEVFIDGARVNKDVDFLEMRDGSNVATSNDKDRTTKYFKVLRSLADGQVVSYKISRYVWSYDQLNEMMEEIEAKAVDAQEKCTSLQEQINNFETNVVSRLGNIENLIEEIQTSLEEFNNCRKKDDKIKISDIDTQVLNKLVKNTGRYEFNATTLNIIPDCDDKDYVVITCVTPDTSFNMKEGIHYTLEYSDPEDGISNATINLEPEMVAPDNNLHVDIIRIGAE